MSSLWPPPSAEPVWGSVAELRADTARYERSWWKADPRVQQACLDSPGLRLRLADLASSGRIVTTTDVHADTTNGVYSPDRGHLQQQVAAQMHHGDPTAQARPVAYFTLGSPGAGKSSVLRSLVTMDRMLAGRAGGYVAIDADQVRGNLPEYAGGLGSAVVAQECFDITYDLVFPAARVARFDLVHDSMGRPAVLGAIEALRGDGYEVHVLLAEAPVQVCLERVERRALADGRLVAPELITSVRPEARATFTAAVAADLLLTGWAVVDTATRGAPTLLKCGGRWADAGQETLAALLDPSG